MTPVNITANCTSVSYGQQTTMPIIGGSSPTVGTIANITFQPNKVEGLQGNTEISVFALSVAGVTGPVDFFPGQTYTITIQ